MTAVEDSNGAIVSRQDEHFILIRPGLVKRVGNGNAALVYALIEFRCAQPGQDRMEDKTGRWWRASIPTISDGTGLTVKMARTALHNLVKLGEIESWTHRAGGVSDQTMSYRPTPLPAIGPNGRMHMPKRANGRSDGCPNGPMEMPERADHHLPKRADVPSIEELKEGGAPARLVQPTREPADTQPPPLRCPKHLNDPNPPNCHACGEARRVREEWEIVQRRVAAAERSAEARGRADDLAREIAACPLCDEDGYAGRSVCTHDPNQLERNRAGIAQVRAELSKRRNPA